MTRVLPALLVAGLMAGCAPGPPASELVIYSGRSKSLVDPLIERFTAETGIEVQVRYGDTAQLAVALMEEGPRSPADVFWAQDAGALGALDSESMLAALPDTLLGHIPGRYRGLAGTWIGTSGRARALAFSTERTDPDVRPASILDLTQPAYGGRVGWAPTNASFQSAVTAMRKQLGDEVAREWLLAMRQNGARAYSNNRSILEGIAGGEIDWGLPNHYYLLRYLADRPDWPVGQTGFARGDVGNLVNVAGVGVLTSSSRNAAAFRFVSFLLSPDAQAYFATETFEVPLLPGTPTPDLLSDADSTLGAGPEIDLNDLQDLDATLDLLRDVGLL